MLRVINNILKPSLSTPIQVDKVLKVGPSSLFGDTGRPPLLQSTIRNN